MGVAESPLDNPRLEKVAQELAKFKSPVEASKAAGYKPGSSFDSNARKRAQHSEVRARVEYLQRISGVVAAADSAWVQRELMEIAGVSFDVEEIAVADKLKALDMLCKIGGHYAPTKVAPTNPEGNAPYDPREINDETRIAALEAFMERVKLKSEAA